MQKTLLLGYLLVACWTASSSAQVLGGHERPSQQEIAEPETAKQAKKRVARSVGGEEVYNETQFPFVVALLKNGQHKCGGSIIDAAWVITAAHCVESDDEIKFLDVLAGSLNVHKRSSHAQSRKVEKVFRYPLYNILPKAINPYDIALLKVVPPFNFTASQGSIAPILLAESNEGLSGFITALGWGHTDVDVPNKSGQLRALSLRVLPDILCSPPLPSRMSTLIRFWDFSIRLYNGNPCLFLDCSPSFCAGGGGTNALQNDSGGPAAQRTGGRLYLKGIVIGVNQLFPRAFPGSYTRVSFFIPWIKEVMDHNS